MENEYKTNLLKRFITSIGIIVPIILVIMLQNFWVFTVMISIICCLAFHEWVTNNLINRYLFGFNLIFLFWFCSVYFVYDYSLMLDDALVQFSEVFSSLSVYDIFLLIVLNTAIFDTVAYVVGSNFGKNYITPRISPNKTFEGFVGGISGSAIFSLIICQAYNLNFLTLFPNIKELQPSFLHKFTSNCVFLPSTSNSDIFIILVSDFISSKI